MNSQINWLMIYQLLLLITTDKNNQPSKDHSSTKDWSQFPQMMDGTVYHVGTSESYRSLVTVESK